MKNYNLKVNGQEFDVQMDEQNISAQRAHVIVNGVDYDVEIAGAKPMPTSKPQVSPVTGETPNVAQPKAVAPSAAPQHVPSASGDAKFVSPLPGTILAIKVSVGDKVTVGQTIMILEAMKMENSITSDREGEVKQICVQQGASVMEGETLIVIE